jgi:hypothetical protein
MRPAEIAKPLGVFVVVILVILAGTAVLGAVSGGGGGAPDGENVQGQSPAQFQPDRVNPDVDPEEGEITVDSPEGEKKILIDNQHGNLYDRDDLEPIVEALVEAGHEVDFAPDVSSGDDGFGSSGGYNATLQEYDAVLVINPTGGFTEAQRNGLQTYTENDGRVAVLGEPTQVGVSGSGLLASLSTISFGANDLTSQYGAHMGAEALFNVDDSANDNSFKGVNAVPDGTDSLTEGVDTVTFDNPGYIVTTGSNDVEVLYTAADGTKTLDSRREGTYVTAVRTDNMVFVADSDFVDQSEVYDADNEVFVSNMLNFLVSGDKPDDIPETTGENSSDGGF